MQTRTFFMRDQVHHRVDDLMTGVPAPERLGEHGGTALAVVVVVLTVLNVLAVAPAT